MNELMTELLIEEFDDLFEDVINEEMNDKQRKAALKKLKSGMVYKQLPSIFKEKETILAAGLSVDMVQNDIGKKYSDAFKAFNKNTTDQAIFNSAKHVENIAAAKAAKAVLKKYYGRVEKISASLAKGSKKRAAGESKLNVTKANLGRKNIMAKESAAKKAADEATALKAEKSVASKAKREAKKAEKEKAEKKVARDVKKKKFTGKVKQKLAKINFVTGK